MLGVTHAASGMLVGLATLPWAITGPWWVQAGWVVVCGGAAVLPDLDQPGSMVARMWGPLTGALAAGVSRLAGGHRAGTHDALLAPLVVGLLAWGASWWLPSFAVVVAVTVGLTLRVTVLGRAGVAVWVTNLVGSGWAGWVLAQQPSMIAYGHLWLPIALMLGVWAHQLGDLITPEGLPVPVWGLVHRQRRVALGLFRTGSSVERVVVGPVLAVAVAVLGCYRFGLGSPLVEALRRLA